MCLPTHHLQLATHSDDGWEAALLELDAVGETWWGLVSACVAYGRWHLAPHRRPSPTSAPQLAS